MSHFIPDKIVDTIRERGALRTPALALTFDMTEEQIDQQLGLLCAAGGPLVRCDVELAVGKKVKEYRCSLIGGGKCDPAFYIAGAPRRAVEPKANQAFGSAKAVTQALAARFQKPADPHFNHVPPTARAAPNPITPRKEADAPMTTASRIINATKKLGPMTVPQIRSVVDEQHVPAICSQLVRKRRLVRLGGGHKSTIYGLPGQKAPLKPVRGAKQGGRPSMRKKRAAQPAPAVTVARGSGTFRPAIASDGALLLMGAATPGELSPAETRVLAEFLRRVDRTGVRA